MWIVSRRPLLGGSFVLHWATLLVAALVAAILSVVVLESPAHAADVSWEGNALKYDNRSYQGPRTAPANSPLGIDEGSQYFEAREGNTIRVVYFPRDANLEEATGAQFAQYIFTPPDTYARDGAVRTVSVESKAEAGARDGEQREEGTTSCAVNGIGYILCPFMNFIANSMDIAFDVLSSFLKVEPLSMNQESSLYTVWKYMLAFANVLFVIAFLVVIGSYMTEVGLKQHDIRFIIPRLIVASILVNVSYHVCALAVDVSNIIGMGLQDFFEGMRESIVNSDAIGDFEQLTWSNVTGYVLSGGTLLAGTVLIGGQALVLGPAAILMLVPILTSAIIAIIVAVLILAARQALIIALIMIAPIAFVAFILPGTQKYFSRWQGIFMNMLLVFPLFSLLFGGSQLAAFIIAQNANDIQTILFAMFIQVAPLVITPFLIKFSGQLLGRIAGMVNNPAKGLKDRADNWANDEKENARARRLQENSRGWRTPGIALAQRQDARKRRKEGMRKVHEAMRSAQFDETDIGQMLAERTKRAEMLQQTANNVNEAAWQRAQVRDQDIQIDAVKAHVAEVELKADKAKTEEYMQGLMSKQGIDMLHAAGSASEHDLAVRSLARQAQNASHRAHAAASATQMAQNQERLEYAQDMIQGDHAEELQVQAAGIAGDKGRMLAAAQAVQEMRSDFGKSSGAMKEMLDHFKVSGDDVNKLAGKKGNVSVDLGNGKQFIFRSDDEHAVDAAIESVFEKKGNYANMRELVKLSGTEAFADHRATIASGVAKNMVGKAGFMGGRSIDVVTTGGVDGTESYDDLIRRAIAGGKFKQDFFATNDTTALDDVYKVMASRKNLNTTSLSAGEQADYLNRVQNLANMAYETLRNDNIRNNLTAGSEEILEKIVNEFGGNVKKK